MSEITKIFHILKNETLKYSSGYKVTKLPGIVTHRMGISEEGFPMFFIKCYDDIPKFLDYNLELISVLFNKKCQLYIRNKLSSVDNYTILSLKIDNYDLQIYFLEIAYMIIKKLPHKPKTNDLKVEIDKLINLFSKLSQPPKKTTQGLWSELLVIQQSNNIDYLVKSWHNEITDKFDFNDGIDKVEVKSTSTSRRKHNFSIEQLNPNINSSLLIASLFVVETGIGKSIYDLITLIEKKLKDKNILLSINEKVTECLGKDFEKSFYMCYDYQLAVDSLAFYDIKDIPKIESFNIPSELSNVRFDCDLTRIRKVSKRKFRSKLFKSLP